MLKLFKRYLSYLFEMCKYYFLLPYAYLKYCKKDIYLISERGVDARDNGAYIFRYIRENHPNINAYYVISNDSPDRESIKQLGNLVTYKSLKHYLLFIASKYMISTHIMGYAPNRYFYTRFGKYILLSGKKIFLQHGVSYNKIPALYSERTKLDLFFCGSKVEAEYVRNNFGYNNNEVKYTGFARYDGLHDIITKKQILIMPTWRRFLENLSQEEFLSSEYVKRWNSLLTNEKLLDLLEKNDLQLVFYPHFNVQKNLICFRSNNVRVKIASINNYDVQKLLKESIILITDYSSVFFDFGYMRKPCLYYQFDFKEFYMGHYEKEMFDFNTMGFGEVTDSENNLVNYIEQYINNEFKMNANFHKNADEFFELYDTHNCERIFNEIKAL